MAAKKGHNIANGIISCIVLACGISFCVLVACLTKTVNKAGHGERHGERHHERPHERHHFDSDHDSGEYKRDVSDFNSGDEDDDGGYYNHHFYNHHYYRTAWTFGFAFIITGLTGIICAVVKKRGGYITHMVFGIITLILKGALFVFSIYAFQVLATTRTGIEDCMTVGDKCVCSSSVVYNGICEHTNRLYSIVIGILSVVVIGWILTLVTTILSGILGCKQEVQAGMVVRHPMATTVVQVPSQMYPQKSYLPQTHDNAKLVSNMEYQPGLYGK